MNGVRVSQGGRLRQIGAGQQDEELLAAEAVGEVERPQLLAQGVSDVTQDRDKQEALRLAEEQLRQLQLKRGQATVVRANH